MSHTHNITDVDKHFVIDPVSKTITNDSGKLVIVQGDHNSERYTFEVPRYVEDHDMGESTRIEVHFSNYIRTKKEINNDMYPVAVADIRSTKDKVFFSWVISGNATKLVGYLTFSVTFICHDDDNNVVYTWSTGIYESISVIARHNNTESVLQLYPDLYEQLKKDIMKDIPTSDGTIDNVIDFGDNSSEDGENNTDTPSGDDNTGGNPGGSGDNSGESGGGSSTDDEEQDNVVEFDDLKPSEEDDNVVEF